MGQPQSSEEGRRQEEEERVPYTKYSLETPTAGDRTGGKRSQPTTVRGITVVNPRPEQDLRKNQPLELQKLDKIHRFWPILKSSVQNTHPVEKISDGLEYKDLLSMCIRYKDHIQDTAAVVAVEQRALASRLKDLEMFSAGIYQQLLRGQERMQRTLSQLEKVKEVSTALEEIDSSMEQCVHVLQQLNQVLPEGERLEPFLLHPHLEEEEERQDDTSLVDLTDDAL